MTVHIGRRRFMQATCTALLLGSAMPARAFSPLVAVPNPGVVGKGRLQVLMMPILDLTLYGPGGTWTGNGPFALRADYLTHLTGKGMARRAAIEMRATGKASDEQIAEWQGKLQAILPDVAKGDTLHCVRTAARTTAFYQDGSPIGSIDDAAFADTFFAICLGPRTSQPALRRQLLGLG